MPIARMVTGRGDLLGRGESCSLELHCGSNPVQRFHLGVGAKRQPPHQHPTPVQCPLCQVTENRSLLKRLIFTLQMGAGTGYFLQLATGSPHGLDTTRGVPGDRLMSPRTPAAPKETVSLRWGWHVPQSHLVISPLLTHLHGGVLTTSLGTVGQPCEKVHPCSGPVFLAEVSTCFQPSLSSLGPQKMCLEQPLRAGMVLVPFLPPSSSPLQFRFPRAHSAGPGAGTGYLWGGRETCLGRTSVPCSCVLSVPVRAL